MQAALRLTRDAEDERILWLVLFAFALLVRLVVIDRTVGFSAAATLEPAADSRIHMAIVQSLLEGRGYRFEGRPTAITPPLYIVFLAGLYGIFGNPAAVRVVQAIMGAGGCVLLYGVGRRVADRATGIVAAVLLGLHPLAAYLAGLHLTENLFLFLLLCMLVQSLRVADRPTPFAAVGLGGLFGLVTLTRALFLGFLPFVFAWAIGLWGWRNPVGYRVFALVVLGAAVVVLPWTVRNAVALGAFVPVQSNGGMVFWAGNNQHADGQMIWPTKETWSAGRPPDNDQYGWRGMNVAEENRRYVDAAVTWIRQHPRAYLHLLSRKLERLYGFARATDTIEPSVPTAVVVFYAELLVAALVGLVVTIRQWKALSLLFGLVAFTNLTTLLFSGATRYIVPMLPSLAVLAAAALVTGWSGVRRPLEVARDR